MAIGSSPSGVLEEALPKRPKISLVISSGIDMVIVSKINYWIPENEQGNMFLWQANVTKALSWDNNAYKQNQEIEMEP